MRANSVDTELRALADEITAVIDGTFATLHEGADKAAALWRRVALAGRISTDELRALRPVIESTLAANSHFNGVGLEAEPGALLESALYQEWWRRQTNGELQFLDARSGYCSQPYDYTGRPWFTATRLGLNCVHGPYVDLAGSDLYVLTFAVPVQVDGEFLGAYGADVPLTAFEHLVADHVLRQTHDVVVLRLS